VLHNSLSHSIKPVLELAEQKDQEHIEYVDVSVPNDQTQTHGMNSPLNHGKTVPEARVANSTTVDPPPQSFGQ